MNIPEGWKLVPVEPTDEMASYIFASSGKVAWQNYRAMLAAAPTPPAQSHDKAMADYNEPAMESSWQHLKTRLGSKEWTTGEACNYRGFFAWGWEARRQYKAPPAPEVEPVAVVKWWNTGGSGEFQEVQWTRVVPKDWTKLYTHPANDGLRKAAEEVCAWFEQANYFSHGGEVIRRFQNLRAELDKGKS